MKVGVDIKVLYHVHRTKGMVIVCQMTVSDHPFNSCIPYSTNSHVLSRCLQPIDFIKKKSISFRMLGLCAVH